MTQTRLFLTAPRSEAERIYGILERNFEDDGLPLAIIETDEERQLFEVSLYAGDDVDLVVERMRKAIDGPSLAVSINRETLPEMDWVAHSLQGLSAVRAGRFLVHGSHERHLARPGEFAIEIEAGLAFGTGHHGTTAGCLKMIADVLKRERPCNALDLGTGSAVLAIALAKLAHIPVLATDIDPIATHVAQENIKLNKVARWVEAETAPGFHHRIFAAWAPFDLIVANILALPLMRLAPQMARHLAAGGSIILSGILDRQRDAVVSAYVGQGFRHMLTTHREGWVTIHLKR